MSRMRFLAGVLSAAALTLTACGANTGEPAQTPGNPVSSSADQPESTPTVGDTPTQAPPTPPATPPESDPGSTSVTADNLPTADDLEWHAAGDWQVGEDETNPDAIPTDTCQREPWPGADSGISVLGRNYTLKDGADGDVAHVVIFAYPDESSAEQAYETARDWSRDCTGAGLDGLPNAQTEVDVPTGSAEFSEWSKLDEATDTGTFTMVGVTQRENRVAWVVMQIEGQDNNWDYEPNGEVGALHPMIRSLPKVNERLGNE